MRTTLSVLVLVGVLLATGCGSGPAQAKQATATPVSSATPAPSASATLVPVQQATPPPVVTEPAVVTPAPPSLEVTAQGLDTVVKLAWQPWPGASGYLVHRDGASLPLNPTPIAETSFEDIGLTNGRAYSYVVIAVDQVGGEVARSAEIKASSRSQ